MKKRQRGMTFLGILTILIILGAAIYGGIRAVPVYLEYMEVSRAMEQVKDEHSAIETSAQMIRNSLERRWDVEDIKGLSWKEVEIKKTSEGFEVRSAVRGRTAVRRKPVPVDQVRQDGRNPAVMLPC